MGQKYEYTYVHVVKIFGISKCFYGKRHEVKSKLRWEFRQQKWYVCFALKAKIDKLPVLLVCQMHEQAQRFQDFAKEEKNTDKIRRVYLAIQGKEQ